MKPGGAFNPRFEACGFHPEEIVARRRDLTDGQKWLYQRMVNWSRSADGDQPNERAGEVWRSHANIALELGKSAKQIGRDLATLEAKRLLAHRKRDGRKSNTYVFLFHADFDRTSTSTQMDDPPEVERTPASAQEPDGVAATENLNGHPRPVRIDLSGHPRPSNQKVFNQQQLTRSQDCGQLRESSATNSATARAAACRKSQPVLVPAPPANWPMGGWTSREDFEAWWADLVREHRNKHHSTAAKAKALEQIRAGQLDRAQFDQGYAALCAANASRWAEQNGRFVTNLLSILEDCLWKFTPRPAAASEYEDSEAYVRRVANE